MLKFENINIENEEDENVQQQQFILYPDESHDLSNLEIESNIYLATTSSSLNPNADDLDDQQQSNQTSSIGNQIITTSSTNEQNISTTISTIKIRLKSSDENENTQKQFKKSLTEQQQQQQQPLVTQQINLNDSQIQILDDDDGNLTSTEEELDIPKIQTTIAKKLNLEKAKPQNNKKQIITQSNVYRTQFNIEQFKAGLTNKSEITFIQLYLALNKPTVIKLKYEWQHIKTKLVNNETTNVEQIDKQRFYIQILAKVAESYLSEMKIQQEGTTEARLVGSTKKQTVNNDKQTLPAKAINENSVVSINEANKTQKMLQDMSSKARKLRQRKAIVVKSTRGARDSCESPTSAIMSPTTSTTTTSTNIVLSAPVAAVARQIVNITSNDGFSSYLSTQRKSITNSLANQNVPIANSYQNNNILIGYQDQQQQQQGFNMQQQQNYSHVLTTFLNENNSTESDYSSNNCTYNNNNNNSSLNNVILHSNLILDDDNGLIPPLNSMQNEHHQQQQSDLSLIDISLNNDSVFGLNENSNMSSLSSKLTNFFLWYMEVPKESKPPFFCIDTETSL